MAPLVMAAALWRWSRAITTELGSLVATPTILVPFESVPTVKPVVQVGSIAGSPSSTARSHASTTAGSLAPGRSKPNAKCCSVGTSTAISPRSTVRGVMMTELAVMLSSSMRARVSSTPVAAQVTWRPCAPGSSSSLSRIRSSCVHHPSSSSLSSIRSS